MKSDEISSTPGAFDPKVLKQTVNGVSFRELINSKENDAGQNFCLYLFHKFGFQLHCADAINPAVNIMVAFDETDVFYLGSDFNYR